MTDEFDQKIRQKLNEYARAYIEDIARPEDLIKNPHVKKLVEALKILQKREYPTADIALKDWEGRG